MVKTGKQIQEDIYQLLKDSTLYAMISGDVYHEGYRPRDSRLEDAVVIFTAGVPEQVQTGVVTVNIFVPDIAPYDNGLLVEDGERTAYIEKQAQKWVEEELSAVNTYDFGLQSTIYTENEPSILQHFVVVKLKYKLIEL